MDIVAGTNTFNPAAPGEIGGTTPGAGAFTTVAGTTGTFTGALNISGASAGQISFPATQNASAGANVLDDYEEGTWTPVYTYATAGDVNIAYSKQLGFYVKIGQSVTIWCHVVTSTHTFSTASGANRITGLPFTSFATSGYEGFGELGFAGVVLALYTTFSARVTANVTYADFLVSGTAQPNDLLGVGTCASATQQERHFTITYRATA